MLNYNTFLLYTVLTISQIRKSVGCLHILIKTAGQYEQIHTYLHIKFLFAVIREAVFDSAQTCLLMYSKHVRNKPNVLVRGRP